VVLLLFYLPFLLLFYGGDNGETGRESGVASLGPHAALL